MPLLTKTDTRTQGFNVPEPLRKYIDGAPEFIPFTKELPKDSTTQKAKDKAGKADLPLR
jgi:seryl-tRNA synthetase